MMTIDWLFIGFALGFVTAAWICPAVNKAIRKTKKRGVGTESLWHNAKENPPKVPGVYYGKKDDTNSAWLCRYRDGVWVLDAYPQQKMEIVQWADYTYFYSDEED